MKKYFPTRHFGTSAKLWMSHYETLGISREATQAEVKAAYYKRSMELHPDKVTGNREEFEKVTNAYKVLSDARLRKIHNQMTSTDKRCDGRVQRNGSSQRVQFSSSPPAYDFDGWMRRHYGNNIVQEVRAETKNRVNQRQMKSDVAERENFVFGVLVLTFLLAGYTFLKSGRDETSSLDKCHPNLSKENSTLEKDE